MKKFKSFIKEGGSYNFVVNDDPIGFGNPVVLKKINGLIGRMCMENKNSADLEPLVRQIRSSLSKMGLTFGEVPPMTEESCEASYPLTLFGGRFGKLPETPIDEFVNDDGLQGQVEGGLSLNIRYEMDENNTCRMYAEIK